MIPNRETYIKDVIECIEGFFKSGVTRAMFTVHLEKKIQWKENLGEGFLLDEEEMEEVMKASLEEYVDTVLTKFVDLGFVDLGVDEGGSITYRRSEKGDEYLKKHYPAKK